MSGTQTLYKLKHALVRTAADELAVRLCRSECVASNGRACRDCPKVNWSEHLPAAKLFLQWLAEPRQIELLADIAFGFEWLSREEKYTCLIRMQAAIAVLEQDRLLEKANGASKSTE